MTKNFAGADGRVTTLKGVGLEWSQSEGGRMEMQEVTGSDFELKADLVLLAMGFVHPIHEGNIEALKVNLDDRGNVDADTEAYQTVTYFCSWRYAAWSVACRLGDPNRQCAFDR